MFSSIVQTLTEHLLCVRYCAEAAKMKTKSLTIKNSEHLECFFLPLLPDEQLVIFEGSI
jgi:hypothetical protein